MFIFFLQKSLFTRFENHSKNVKWDIFDDFQTLWFWWSWWPFFKKDPAYDTKLQPYSVPNLMHLHFYKKSAFTNWGDSHYFPPVELRSIQETLTLISKFPFSALLYPLGICSTTAEGSIEHNSTHFGHLFWTQWVEWGYISSTTHGGKYLLSQLFHMCPHFSCWKSISPLLFLLKKGSQYFPEAESLKSHIQIRSDFHYARTSTCFQVLFSKSKYLGLKHDPFSFFLWDGKKCATME